MTTLAELNTMTNEEVKLNFKDMMQEIVERHGDNKDDRQSAESTEAKASDKV